MTPIQPPYEDCDTRDCSLCIDAPVCPYLLDLFEDELSLSEYEGMLIFDEF